MKSCRNSSGNFLFKGKSGALRGRLKHKGATIRSVQFCKAINTIHTMGKRIDWGTVIAMTFDGVSEQNNTALLHWVSSIVEEYGLIGVQAPREESHRRKRRRVVSFVTT